MIIHRLWVKFNAYKQTTIFTNGSILETSECKTLQSKRFSCVSESCINSKELLSQELMGSGTNSNPKIYSLYYLNI